MSQVDTLWMLTQTRPNLEHFVQVAPAVAVGADPAANTAPPAAASEMDTLLGAPATAAHASGGGLTATPEAAATGRTPVQVVGGATGGTGIQVTGAGADAPAPGGGSEYVSGGGDGVAGIQVHTPCWRDVSFTLG